MPGWLEALTVGQVIGWLVALGVLAGGLRWLRPIADGIHQFLTDWAGEPARPGVPARLGVMAQLGHLREELERVQQDAASAAFNTQSNHGSSSHDALLREMRDTRQEMRDTRQTVAKLEGLVLAVSRKQSEQSEQQQAFEVAVRESIADRAEIREHIGLPPPEPESEEQ